MNIAPRLRDARRAARMTQELAAYWSETSREQLSNIESGRNEPRLSTVAKLADVYGTTVSELIGEVPRKAPDMNAHERSLVDLFLKTLRGEL
jgi:transcriptional regulator with XRE-family HTH domain